ncbi:MAG: hypothetical protein ACI392_08280 [Paludibacteraceae bacterium]
MTHCKYFVFVCCLTVCLLLGCSVSEPWNINYTASVMTVRQLPDNGLCFVSDDSLVYVPTDSNMLLNTFVGHRYYVEYWSVIEQPDGIYLIEVSLVYPARELPVLLNDTVTCIAAAGTGIGVPAVWCSGHYLNMVIEYYGTNGVPHDFSLITSNMHVGDDGRLSLELHHDARNDVGDLLQYEVVSYDMTSLPNLDEVLTLTIRYRQYDMTYGYVAVVVP